MFHKLLIPVDFGHVTRDVAKLAAKLAAPSAHARIVHVVDRSMATVENDYKTREALEAAALEALEELADLLEAGPHMKVEFELRDGTTHESILEAIDTYEPDLVVMGSHGRTGLPRLMLGSDVQRVMRESARPICVVKGAVGDDRGFQHIALATDLSKTTRRATHVSLELLRGSGARGQLVNVIEPDVWFTMQTALSASNGGVAVTAVDPEIEAKIRERRIARERQLVDHAKRMSEEGIHVVPEMLDGEPATVFEEYIQREGIELVILGSHHYRGIDRLLSGSIAEKILRTVDCPVLIVPDVEPSAA